MSRCDTHHHEPWGAPPHITFQTKEIAPKGWDTLWGAGEKQFGIGQDLMGYLWEEPKVGQERGFGDLGRNKMGNTGVRIKGGQLCVRRWLVSALVWSCPAWCSLSCLDSNWSRTLPSGACMSRGQELGRLSASAQLLQDPPCTCIFTNRLPSCQARDGSSSLSTLGLLHPYDVSSSNA